MKRKVIRSPLTKLPKRHRKVPSFAELFKSGERGVQIIAGEIIDLCLRYPALRFYLAAIWTEVERQRNKPAKIAKRSKATSKRRKAIK